MKDADRRSFLKISGAALGIGVLYSAVPTVVSAEAQDVMRFLGKQNGEMVTPFSFIQLSDAHVGFNGPPDPLGTKAFERAVDASRRGNTAVSFVDVRGLIAVPSYGVAQDTPPPPGELGAAMAIEDAETAGGEYLAEMTGGSMVRTANDLAGSLTRLADESSAYYLLGYQADRPRDGQWSAATTVRAPTTPARPPHRGRARPAAAPSTPTRSRRCSRTRLSRPRPEAIAGGRCSRRADRGGPCTACRPPAGTVRRGQSDRGGKPRGCREAIFVTGRPGSPPLPSWR